MSKHKKVQPIGSIREMMEIAVRENPELISYQFKEGEKLVSVTTREFYDSVENLGAKLTEMGFGKSHIACVGENSYPWIQTFLTSLMTAGVFVPLDKELPAENLVYLLNESDSDVRHNVNLFLIAFRLSSTHDATLMPMEKIMPKCHE